VALANAMLTASVGSPPPALTADEIAEIFAFWSTIVKL